jgi:acyl-homoserine-lactone acylase
MNETGVNRSGRKALMIAFVCALASTACTTLPPEPPSELEILWDTWGVPHIFAPDDEALYYGLGWTQMQNHADVILRLYGQARGRAAEYWGERYVDSDSQVHRLASSTGQAWVKLQDPAF